MSKLETNTIDTISGSTTLTLGGTNATTIAQDSATTITGLKSTGIDDNATSTAITIDSTGSVGIGTTAPFNTTPSSFTISNTTPAIFLEDTDSTSYGVGRFIFSNGILTYLVGSRNGTGTSGSSEYMRIDSNGNVLINATSQSNVERVNISYARATHCGMVIDCTDSTAITPAIKFFNTNGDVGSIDMSGSSTSYTTSSDYRLKENVSYDFDATTRLKQLRPARFNFIADADTTVDGFIAHEVSSVVPEAITGTHNEVEVWKEGEELPEGVSVGDNKLDENGNTIPVYQGIDQAKLVPLLVKTIQELEARITELENA